MAKHSSEPRVYWMVSSSNCYRCPLLDSSHRRSASAVALDKPQVVSSFTLRAQCTSISSPSRRTIFRTRPYVSS
jgi:hypothetical protein